jgi:hypothetical protein
MEDNSDNKEKPLLKAEKEEKNEEYLKNEKRINPNWDGSEAEFVEDDDANEYQDEYSGIKIRYKLDDKEIYESLKHAGYYNTSRTKAIIETALLLVVLILFLISFFIYGNIINIIMVFICAAVASAIWFVPHVLMKRQLENQKYRNKEINVEIYPDEIEIEGDTEWEINLDGTSELKDCDDMFILFLPNNHIFPIPKRVIEPSVMLDIESMLRAGTSPKSESKRRFR